MRNYLFPTPPISRAYSLFLLALRIIFGILLVRHGIEKLANYTELCFSFPAPIGLGKEIALILVVFTELCCGLTFIFGILYRLCLIPIIIVMGVAFFHVHEGNITEGELALSYLFLFILMYIAGPGKYSVDAVIYKHLNEENDNDDF